LIILKRPKEILMMEEPNRIVAECLVFLYDIVKPGISTFEINERVENHIVKSGGIPSFKNYNGFPSAACVSINEVVVHGIPDRNRILKEGDIVTVDVGAYKNGYHGDAARTYPVGKISGEAERLLEVTKRSLDLAIEAARNASLLGEISHSVQEYVEGEGFSIIREFVGHGIGKNLHEDPQVPNYGLKNRGPKLRKGMTLAIEPMVSVGDWRTEILEDGFTAVTLDRSLAAHFEDTIAFTEDGVKILTRLQ